MDTDSKDPLPTSYEWPQKSPIAILPHETQKWADPPVLIFDYEEVKGSFVDKGHRNFVVTSGTSRVRLGNITATLSKIHLHMPAEHCLGGDQPPGELHLIHTITAPDAGSTLLVIGIWFAVDDQCRMPNFFVDWANASCGETTLHPSVLLPESPHHWFRYEGSLTSSPYTESVSWIVMREFLRASSDDLEELRKQADQPTGERQALNRRFVLRSF